MGRLRVRSAALQLRLPVGGEEAAPRLAEVMQTRFIPSVLDALRRELDDACGEDAVIRIPKLKLRLRVGPNDTDGSSLARQVARDLAEEVRASLTRASGADGGPVKGVGARYWPQRTAFLAAELAAAARGSPRPDGDIEEIPSLVARLLAEDDRTIASTLTRAETDGTLPGILAALPRTQVARLRDRITPLLGHRVVAVFAARIGEIDVAPGRTPAPSEQAPPPTGQSSRPRPDTAKDALRDGSSQVDHASEDADPVEKPPPEKAHGPIPEAEPRRQAEPEKSEVHEKKTGTQADPDADPRLEPPRSIARHTGQERAPSQAGPVGKDEPSGAISVPQYSTRFGLLPCLITVAMRLDLPKRLWRIGVPEGAVLSSVAGVIIGDPSDPIAAILAPEFPGPAPPVPPLPDWARAEITDAISGAAAELTGHAVTGATIEMRRMSLAKEVEWRLSEWGAATLLSVAEAMLEGDSGGDLAPRLRAPGVIEIQPETIAVRLPLEAVDLDLRRAGLDHDPGWLGWLERRMTLQFGTDEEDWAT